MALMWRAASTKYGPDALAMRSHSVNRIKTPH
jgi:hypothetical protein